MQKGNFIQRILQFAEKKGFYMILGLCVAAIGVSAYVLFFTAPQPQSLSGEILTGDMTLPEASVSNPVPNVTVQQPEKKAEKKPETQQPKRTEKQPEAPPETVVTAPETKTAQPQTTSKPSASTSAKAVKEPIFTMPLQTAEVQREYSGEVLVFDPTMEDWRTHNGTDFVCESGAQVMAVLDGTVSEIFDDTMMGSCIRIDHGAELESLYCGVTPQAQLKVGTAVSAGQIIGSAGDGVLAESAQPCHLHLEMYDAGYRVDPMTVLK